jgi:hypothetical protein
MSAVTSILARRREAALLFALATVLLLPAIAFAQIGGDARTLTDGILVQFRPIIRAAHFIIIVVAIFLALFNFFKASKGDTKGWITGGLLLIVAFFLLTPATILTMIGMGNLAGCVTFVLTGAGTCAAL